MTEKTKRRAAGLLLLLLCAAAGMRLWVSAQLPDTFYLAQGTELSILTMPYLKAKPKAGKISVTTTKTGNSYNVELSLFGVVPVKTVRAEVSERRRVAVCGTPFGIKMFSSGVMVVGFTEIYTSGGYQNPAKSAGLALGDYVMLVNGQKIRSNEDLKSLVSKSDGAPLSVQYIRKGVTKTIQLTPVLDRLGGGYRTGMWVRDSSAGIGTLTFIDLQRGVFAGLGHSVTDVDTGESLTLASGEIVPVKISGAVPGTVGIPGELKGSFTDRHAIGGIRKNGAAGVYGVLYGVAPHSASMETAQMQEIKTGKAQLITTIDGRGARAYEIDIEKLAYNADDPNKNMLIRVTDPDLLAATGGIVQGMSGSPIIQNDKLVGAVTHVLVKDPTRGFAIFVENMLKTADSIEHTTVGKSA